MKRDDLTGFELSGNKVRKLEFHLAAARRAGADTVVTCGALQSNHCRATAMACARLGLRCRVLLRTPDGEPPAADRGNYLLDLLAGAEVRFVTPEEYRRIDELFAEEADGLRGEGASPWIIPEGASDALGMWGYVEAARELAGQVGAIPGPVGAVWHPASSGGTTAGLAWGLEAVALDVPLVAVSVGEPAEELAARVAAIWEEVPDGRAPATTVEYLDRYVGEGYGVATAEELAVQREATRLTGLLFDPTYTGKALYALRQEVEGGRFDAAEAVIFWHTGGGFAAFAHDWGR